MKPEHAAWTSKAGQPWMPSRRWTMQAVLGNTLSGVVVASTIRSTSPAAKPARSSAARAAATLMSEVVSPSAAMRRRLMPVRSRIQSSEVSRNASNSRFSITRSGR